MADAEQAQNSRARARRKGMSVFRSKRLCVEIAARIAPRVKFFWRPAWDSAAKRRSAVALDLAAANSQVATPGTIGKSGLCITPDKLVRLLLCPV
jgi:hypothetical protein